MSLYTPKGLERYTAKNLRDGGALVMRADHDNYMPDFVAFYHQYTRYIECKRYASIANYETVVLRVYKRQRKQWDMFRKLHNLGVDIIYVIQVKDGCIYEISFGTAKDIVDKAVARKRSRSIPTKRKNTKSKV